MWYGRTKDYYGKYSKELELERFYGGRIRKRMMELLLGRKKFQRILDLGCGTGRWTSLLKGHGKLVSLDFSTARLRNVKSEKLAADCIKTPLKSSSFDLVVSIEVLQHLDPKSAKAYANEIKRLLKKGGIAIIVAKNKLRPIKTPNPIKFYAPDELCRMFRGFDVKILGEKLLPSRPIEPLLRAAKSASSFFESLDIKTSKHFPVYCDYLWAVVKK